MASSIPSSLSGLLSGESLLGGYRWNLSVDRQGGFDPAGPGTTMRPPNISWPASCLGNYIRAG